ncbi:MAG: tRNA uridine-5-carboxymethylaminomethyl(34) synthesis GTPase MnmE, partial [Oscillospiraceae bacterium]|nr:tRNA uridine-5-carboxymethylaminomethyl(34) synthesis GTPase MnmE [Oscillospiraceae bacterium]
TGEGLDLFEGGLDMLFDDDTPCDGSILTNTRQAGAVLRAAQCLDAALKSLRGGLTPDAVLCDVENAMEALGEVTGRTVREDIVARIFERFCVGK